MPKQITEIKKFIILVRRADAKFMTVYKGRDYAKFKLRCSKTLFTLVLPMVSQNDRDKVAKVHGCAPPQLKQKEIKGRKSSKQFANLKKVKKSRK